jgi:hypothetical protein
MSSTFSKKIYINDKCIGKYPCYHFVTLENENKQYKVLMDSIQIYDICYKTNIKPTWYIKKIEI